MTKITRHRIAVFFATLAISLGLLISPLNILHTTPTASAWTGAIPACSVDFGAFNWKTEIKNHAANTQHYDPDQMATILIYKYVGESNQTFIVDMVPNAYLAALTQGTGSPTPKSVEHSIATGTSNAGTEWEVDYVNKTVANVGTVAVNPAKNKKGSNGTGNAADLTCISTAKGYTQQYNWDQVSISETIPNQGTEQCNGALDISCWIGKAFNGIADTFSAVGQAIIKALTWLWAPDGAKTKNEFDSLNSFLSTKLGFLTYPFTFLTDLFNAFGDTTNNWCTTSSCTKNFGNLFGQPFMVNFNQGATTWPTLWSWFLGITRGLVVYGLIMAVRKKYLEVAHK